MKQVTGRTNPTQQTQKVSIRLSLDGHSFSMPEGCDLKQMRTVEWLTPYTVLVPKELFVFDEALAYLNAAGQPPLAGYSAVWSSTDEAVVAVMAVPSKALWQFEQEIEHTSPLLHIPTVLQPTLWIADYGYLIYIKVYNPQLQLAEVVRITTEADRSCLVERLAERLELDRYVLMLDDRAGKLPFYKKQFKKVICE